MAAKGWHKITTGWYRYTNAAGKTLAYAEKYRSFWNVTVLPAAEDALALKLSASPSTLREAKQIAETVYKHQTAKVLAERNG